MSATWHCEKCRSDYAHDEFLSHIRNVHGIAARSGKKSMLMHMRVSGGSIYQYEWTIGGMKFTQTLRTFAESVAELREQHKRSQQMELFR